MYPTCNARATLGDHSEGEEGGLDAMIPASDSEHFITKLLPRLQEEAFGVPTHWGLLTRVDRGCSV